MGYNRDEAEKGPDGRYLEVLCHHGRTKKHCIYCEELATKDFRIKELEQQVATLEEYMLKGVAFRDELQAELTRLREAVEWALGQADCFNEKIMIELRRRAKEEGK